MDYVDLEGPDGTEDNVGGTTQQYYFAPRRDFSSIADWNAAPATIEDLAILDGDHAFKVGKKFLIGYSTRDTGSIDDTPVGERDGRAVVSKFKFLIPGTKAKVLGTLRQAKNDQFIFLAELADGTIRQLGSKRFGADFKFTGKTGTNSQGVRGWEIEVESFEVGPMLYEGLIPLTPAP